MAFFAPRQFRSDQRVERAQGREFLRKAESRLRGEVRERLLLTLPRHGGGRPEAFRRESKTFGEVAILQGIADEKLDQAQGRLQMLVTLGIGAFAQILFAFIRELENTVEEVALRRAAILGKVLAHDQNKGVGSL
jgi:hypothetical protein